jgi:MFS family permease
MIRSFGVPQNAVGKWAGICAAVFSLSQATFGVAWGRFSDTHGRKPAILLGLTATMITSLMWGFSTNLAIAIAARVLAGAGNGNVGIIRTTVAEMVPFKELQPRAFSLMPLVWNIGSIFGPSIGGALANPLDVKPGEERSGGSLFERFPYALPNIVSAIFFAIGITTGLLYLEETLETKQGTRDYGLVLGRKLNNFAERCFTRTKEVLHLQKAPSKSKTAETEPLLKPTAEDEENALHAEPTKPRASPPNWREVLNYQSNMNLLTYTLLAAHAMAFDQLLPVFMQYPPLAPDFHQSNPLQFAGGFGLHHFRIGLLSTCYGIFGMLVQFFLFPPIARKYGILNCLKWCACVFPFCYLATPFTALLPTQTLQVSACFAIMLLKCLCGIFAFPCSTILLTNSASSLRVLGTLNGFATSFSAIGRALGPLLARSSIWSKVKALVVNRTTMARSATKKTRQKPMPVRTQLGATQQLHAAGQGQSSCLRVNKTRRRKRQAMAVSDLCYLARIQCRLLAYLRPESGATMRPLLQSAAEGAREASRVDVESRDVCRFRWVWAGRGFQDAIAATLDRVWGVPGVSMVR